jgi:FKBP-type peptidyl-prolyl cis-trans isomerase
VKVKYRGTLIDGTEFDKNDGISFPLNGVIKGWTEGLQLMTVGSKYMLYVPYYLGYGEAGNQMIKPFSTLVFEVELLAIEK